MNKDKILFGCSLILFALALIFALQTAVAATNIAADAPPAYLHWAWSDVAGWIDFYSTDTVNVAMTELQGYARYSAKGDGAAPWQYISLNCASGPAGSSCTPVSYKVSNTETGKLSGWAWSDAVGWISLSCENAGTSGCAGHDYGVTVVNSVSYPGQAEFEGFAWNDIIGWISFNCNNPHEGYPSGICGLVDYKVMTGWTIEPLEGEVISSTFDTDEVDGVAYNYILWKGVANSGDVRFQLATSNCGNGATNAPTCDQNIGWGGSKTSGDGAFLGPLGTTAADDLYAASGPDVPMPIKNKETHSNKRYFRYRMVILSDLTRTLAPQVSGVIVNWSP
ncbi:MAG: hypothetical protein M1586_00115 [Patescibacteria group bacterium]|nr:hypothetical protein [Patescibacteria group bacterium]MCL5261695.1 hypothetical protein [Patescibacteria group bacterium]